MISKRFAATAAAVALATVQDAAAHVHDDPSDPVSQELMAHIDWINSAETRIGGSCCHQRDVIAAIPESIDAEGRYVVTIPKGTRVYTDPHKNLSFVVENDIRITINPASVLDYKTAQRACEEIKTPTCSPPETINVLFVNPESLKEGVPLTYCYLPLPQAARNGAGQDPDPVLAENKKHPAAPMPERVMSASLAP